MAKTPYLKRSTAKPDRPEIRVKIRKTVIDSGFLDIATKHGRYFFQPHEIREISLEEAEELIKVRTKHRKNTGSDGCDLVIIKEI